MISHFVGWLLFHVSSVDSRARRQLFYVSFVNNYYGLSRDGLKINHKFGFGVAMTMFDEIQQEHQALAKKLALSRQKLPHVAWWDNFSKFRAFSIPTLVKDVFASCLWTGITINEYTGPPVDTSVVYKDGEVVVPAMPATILETRDSVCYNMSQAYDSCSFFFSRSLVKRYGVHSVPLKIDTKEFPDLKDVIESDKNNMTFIHPDKLMKLNIGSNAGLIRILREYQTEHKMHLEGGCAEYKCLNVDENIFWRILKVLLCVADCELL